MLEGNKQSKETPSSAPLATKKAPLLTKVKMATPPKVDEVAIRRAALKRAREICGC